GPGRAAARAHRPSSSGLPCGSCIEIERGFEPGRDIKDQLLMIPFRGKLEAYRQAGRRQSAGQRYRRMTRHVETHRVRIPGVTYPADLDAVDGDRAVRVLL